MGVMNSMATAISGLEAHSEKLGVVTDNIVNANTTGFKGSRTEFQTILAQDLGTSGLSQIGRGVKTAGITNLLNQGAVNRTNRSTDLAINGNGFFVLRSDRHGQTYTRDGSFRFDKEGWLTNLHGYRVQAYEALPDGNISGKLTDVRIPYDTIPAKETKRIQLNVNLDGRSLPKQGLDLNNPLETAHFTTSMQVYDSIGNNHSVSVFFNKVAENNWEWYSMTDGENLAGGTAGQLETVAQGSLIFDERGRLADTEVTNVNTSFANGAIPDQELIWDFGDPINEGGTGQIGTTHYGQKNAMFRNVQDGWAAGVLADASIDGDGLITGVYTNGQNRTLGQVAISRFEATERLAKIGENQFRETTASGQALIGMANTNGRGILMPESLEASNVDLAAEFVEMIKAQRGFQASAKSVSTANEMLDEVVNIMRG